MGRSSGNKKGNWVDPETDARRKWGLFAMVAAGLFFFIGGLATIFEKEATVRKGKYGSKGTATLRDGDAVAYGSIFAVFGASSLVIAFFYFRDYVKR